jgi:hypothetical protein
MTKNFNALEATSKEWKSNYLLRNPEMGETAADHRKGLQCPVTEVRVM